MRDTKRDHPGLHRSKHAQCHMRVHMPHMRHAQAAIGAPALLRLVRDQPAESVTLAPTLEVRASSGG